MDLNLYKQCVEFRKLESKYWTNDCVICYMQIIPSKNIGFACNHNSCISCFTHYLKLTMKTREIPCCFVCRNIVCYMDVDDNNSKKKIMNIINPPMNTIDYNPPMNTIDYNPPMNTIDYNSLIVEENFSQMIYDDDPRRYHPVLLYNRDFRLFYAISQPFLFILVLFIGYYFIK